MLARTDSRARALVLLIVAAVAAAGIGARLVWWQVVQQPWLATAALHQLEQHEDLPAERGEIRDRNGELLATSVEVQSVFATPPSLEDPAMAAITLATVLQLPVAEVRAKLESDRAYVWLRRRVTPEMAERVANLDIHGVGMLAETKRVYPVEGVAHGTTLAAQLIGFVDIDGRGQYGVEAARDDLLAGLSGTVSAQGDVIGRRIADSATLLQEPVDGADLRLTIDSGVQHLLEQEMWATAQANGAVGVTGLIMDAETGAILAMASYPAYDGNEFATTDTERFANPAVARQYEPGSVMKAFTVAAALDAGAVSTTDTFVDDNNLLIGDVRIQNADRYDHRYGHGPITAADVLALSNNVGAAKIGLELGRAELYVEGWTDADGTFHPSDRPPDERILRPATATTMLRLLTNAVDNGIARGGSIDGYTVAGKTGTAQIAGPVTEVDGNGQPYERWTYIEGWIDSSFVGILPEGDTKLVTLILLHRPATWGLYQMAERPETVYARLMPQVLDYLAIPPDRPIDAVAQP
jgi:cell division protein FtsI (penicillin-binding protein 3)